MYDNSELLRIELRIQIFTIGCLWRFHFAISFTMGHDFSFEINTYLRIDPKSIPQTDTHLCGPVLDLMRVIK